MSSFEKQVGGGHYKDFAIQPTEYCQKNKLNFCESCVVKYVSRHKSKNGFEDLAKAIHFIEMLAEIEYPEEYKVYLGKEKEQSCTVEVANVKNSLKLDDRIYFDAEGIIITSEDVERVVRESIYEVYEEKHPYTRLVIHRPASNLRETLGFNDHDLCNVLIVIKGKLPLSLSYVTRVDEWNTVGDIYKDVKEALNIK